MKISKSQSLRLTIYILMKVSIFKMDYMYPFRNPLHNIFIYLHVILTFSTPLIWLFSFLLYVVCRTDYKFFKCDQHFE